MAKETMILGTNDAGRDKVMSGVGYTIGGLMFLIGLAAISSTLWGLFFMICGVGMIYTSKKVKKAWEKE